MDVLGANMENLKIVITSQNGDEIFHDTMSVHEDVVNILKQDLNNMNITELVKLLTKFGYSIDTEYYTTPYSNDDWGGCRGC